MQFSKHMFFVLSFLLAIFSQFSLVIAGEIPGYVGQQNFRLEDDSQLRDFSRRAQDAKVEVARVDQIRAQLGNQARSLTQQRDNILAHMSDLQQRIDGTKNEKISLLSKLAELNKAPEINKDQITNIQNKINEQDALAADLSRQYGASKIDLGPVNVRLDQINHDYDIANRNYQIAMERLQSIARDRDSYRDDLIKTIQYVNSQGARAGFSDGSSDGASLSRKLGQDIGSRDGQSDGFNQGTSDGHDRDYRRGADQGDRDGSARAKSDGLRDGTNEGTISGNQSAARREGEVAGIKRGDASNAANVGIEQGKKAGLARAVETGSIDGNNKGENETVQKFESGELNKVLINGPFAGSFSRRSPSYPGDFNGPNFDPNVYNNREIVKIAYTDGYLDQYRQYTRYEYLRRIDGDYNAVYDSAYANSYRDANNRDYPDYYESGRRDGDKLAYTREYPIAKNAAFRIAFDQYDSAPNRSSGEFKSTYKASELSAYNNRFEEIRSANFKRVELEVFNANIAAQTELYRQKRIGEVTNVYKNNAILAFVSSEMLDGGINGVAKLDGVFQPGETTLHSITLQNFGAKSAQNVSVQLDNGAVVKINEIPARSLVVIKGAGLSQIANNSSIGSTAKTSLKVISKLTSEDVVEAIHFDSIGSGILKSSDQKSVKVAYPMALSGLSLGSQLLKGVANKLSVSISNNSKRPYAGIMQVQVNVNSQSGIVTKEFTKLESIQASAQLSDAEVLVTSDADIYRDLSFSATISQNGVTLGVLSTDMMAMAKAQFADKGLAPVIIANSDKNLKQLLDALSLAGGTDKVSVLDLSLASLNAGTLSLGLSGKVLLVVDNESGVNIKSLNSFIGKSKSSAFVFIDETNSGLKNVLTLGSSKDAQKLLWEKRVVMFTNPHRAEGVQKSSAMIQSSLRSFDKDLALASNLTKTATELLATLKSEINRTSFFTPSNAIKMYSLKAMAEVLCINKAYDESGRIFSRDKKWVEMIGNDQTLFINVLKAASSGEVTEAKLSTILPAIALKDTVSNAMSNADGIYRDMMSKITNATNKVLGN
ncbi:MAG: hypothetical protein Q7U04_01975, partial [Bacteriovorax sp.]|nr:hypothetical protein [Bacteriovorax sp.]